MRYHFVGIGGSGLSAIARVLIERGQAVTGSDESDSPMLATLAGLGARVAVGHRADQVVGAEVVIISSAVRGDNPEVVAALRAGLPVYKRSEFLGELTKGYKTIAVAGTHGKTTTAGLISYILNEAGLSPSFVVGGVLADLGGVNARAGQGELFVIEADEYDNAFLGLTPWLEVITNIEHDHPDFFPTLADVQAAFSAFLARLTPMGWIVGCGDASGVVNLVRQGGLKRIQVYGVDFPEADWTAAHWERSPEGGSEFMVLRRPARGAEARAFGRAVTRLPGLHNIRNALAALCVADLCGVEFAVAAGALAKFSGAGRRFEVRAEARGVVFVDDYAHHPSEIRATLAAARDRFPGRALWAVWQPHTFSRTRALLTEFAGSFEDADHVVVLPVFRSREADDPTFSAKRVVEAMQHREARYVEGSDAAVEDLLARLGRHDVLITLSAGDGNQVGERVISRLAEKIGQGETSPDGTGNTR
jgi:UDP-N-acetylmuramate--alanine ligase